MVWLAFATISAAAPLAEANEASPAKLAPTPLAYVPALIPVRLTPLSDATPDVFVIAEPAALPFNVNETVLPLTPAAEEVSVAERFTKPP
jgi:hypothetical protein